MGITVNSLTQEQYDQWTFAMLQTFEGIEDTAYVDTNGFPTIGIGFRIDKTNIPFILDGMGYANSPHLGALQSAIVKAETDVCFAPGSAGAEDALNRAVNSVLGTNYGSAAAGNFGYGNNTGTSGQTAIQQMDATFQLLRQQTEDKLNAWLAYGPSGTTLPPSMERAALFSLTYNGLIGMDPIDNKPYSPRLQNAITSGDRAEAWYQIRYQSNGGNGGVAIAQRRYEESQIFGLFQNPSDPSLSGAVQAYQMLTAHRTTIDPYESQYGSKAATQNNGILAADNSYAAALTAAATANNINVGVITPVQTLEQALGPAEAKLMKAVDTEYGSLLSGFTPSNSVDIYLNPGRLNSLYSVSSSYSYDLNASASSGNDLLIASTGSTDGITLSADTGNDTLTAGSGSDVLIAGAGQDSLQAGSGNDTLIGGLGNDTMTVGTGQDTLYDLTGSGNTGASSILTIIDNANASAQDSIAIASGIGTPTPLTGGHLTPISLFTWQSSEGTTYTFTPQYVNVLNEQIGTLTISQGALSSDEIIIKDFNLNTAQGSTGDLGIKLAEEAAVGSGAAGSTNPFLLGNYLPASDPTSASGTAQFVVYVSAASAQPQQVNLSFSGGNLADFQMWNDGQWQSIASGTATVTLPANSTQLTVLLQTNQTLTSTQSVTVTAALPGESSSVPKNTFTVDFTAPSASKTPAPTLTPVDRPYTVIGGVSYYQGNGGDDSIVGTGTINSINASNSGSDYLAGGSPNDTIIGGTGNDTIIGGGNDSINASNSLNDSIVGGAGHDTITGGSGADTITGGGGPDIIQAGQGNNEVYADTKVSLGTALANAATGTASGLQGSFLAVGNGNNTVVGGTGNDQFVVGDGNNVLVLGPGNDTVLSGVTLTGTPASGWQDSLLSPEQITDPGYLVYQITQETRLSGFGVQSTGNATGTNASNSNVDSFGVPVGVGNDTIFAGAGNDAIDLSNGNNYVVGGAGNDTVWGGTGQDTIFTGNGNDIIEGQGGSDYIVGGAGNSLIAGGTGNNTIFGGSGNDTIFSGTFSSASGPGNDYVWGGSGNSNISGAGGNDTLIGGSGNDTIWGNQHGVNTGNKYIYGGTGNDVLVAASSGNDTLIGGSGNDTLFGGTGNDTLRAGGAGQDSLYSGSSGGTQVLYAGSGNDLLSAYSTTGAATLYGGSGTDTLYGGAGNDVLYAGSGGTSAAPTEVYAGLGNDILLGGGGSAVLNVEDGFSDLLIGGTGSDTLIGGAGNNTLMAGDGNTSLEGGSGSNTYVFNVGGGADQIVLGAGTNLLQFGAGINPADLTLSAALTSAGVPSLVIQYDSNGVVTVDGGLTTTGALAEFANGSTYTLDQLMAQGNTFESDSAGANGNLLFAGSGGASLVGGTGNDTLYGWGNNDTFLAGSGNDQVYAEDAYDTLVGGTGNDTLAGFGANESMMGGSGNTTFVINNASDVITEASNTGHNTVLSSVSYVQPENVQNLTLTGSANLTATGNDQTGTLTGNAGNDTLIAGSGIDTLVGGSGNDTFVVNNASDVVTDSPNAGSNTVLSSVSYVQPENVQNLTLTGSANLTATGNDQAGVLTANTGNDTLVAGSGVDTLIGGAGNDTFVVNNAADVVEAQSGAGVNTVLASVSYTLGATAQNLTLTGTANLTATGNAVGGVLTANSGNDTLIAGSSPTGAAGAETLHGGAGLDTFVLNYNIGADTAIAPSPAGGVVELGQGLNFSDLSAVRQGNGLLLEITGTTSSLLLKDYFTTTKWVLQNGQGQTETGAQLLAATAQQNQSALAQEEAAFVAQTKGDIIAGLLQQGYVLQANGTWVMPTYVSPFTGYESMTTTSYAFSNPQTGTSYTTQSTNWQNIVQPDADYVDNQYIFSPYVENNTTTVNLASTNGDTPVITTTGQTVTNLNTPDVWLRTSWTQGPFFSSTSAYIQPIYTNKTTLLTIYPSDGGPPVILSESQPVLSGYETVTSTMKTATADPTVTGILANSGSLTTTGVEPQAVSAANVSTQTLDQIQEITVGSGDHTVNAGAWTLVNSTTGNDTIYDAGFAYGGSGNDTMIGGGTLVAGSGNDLLVGGATMVAGTGNDSIFGGGDMTPTSTIVINANSTGNTVIGDVAHDTTAVMDAYYAAMGIPSAVNVVPPSFAMANPLSDRYQYAGLYRVVLNENALYGFTSAVTSLLIADEVVYVDKQQAIADVAADGLTWQQATAQGTVTYMQPLPVLGVPADNSYLWQPSSYYATANIPEVTFAANNYSQLAPYYANGTIPIANVVKFGTGITLANLHFSWGQVTGQIGGPDAGGTPSLYTTLDISWAAGQSVQVMIPHANDPLGSGVQEFTFANGTQMTMAQMIALAPPAPTFDPQLPSETFTFSTGMGQQIVGDQIGSIQFAAGITPSSITVAHSGDDLLIYDNNGADVLRVSNWFSHPAAMPTASATFANGTTWSASELTSLGLVQDYAAGNQTLTALPGFSNTLMASANDTLVGASGHDTFVYNEGDGTVVINAPMGNNTLEFGAGITSSMITLGVGPQDQLVLHVGTQGEVEIDGFVPSNALNTSAIQKIVFLDPSVLTYDQLVQRGFDIYAGAGNVSITGTNLTNRLYGGAGQDTLIGSGTADTLFAGTGVDTLIGGTGQETFVVNNTADVVVEKTINRNDTVLSSVDYVQPENVENLTLTGTANLTATGNNQAGVLTGNAGNDTLIAGTGSDTLVAGAGVDTLVGGRGHDTFVVNNAADVISVPSPAHADSMARGFFGGRGFPPFGGAFGGPGSDTVLSSVDYVQPENVQNLTLTGTANLTATGNNQAGVLTANSGNDLLTAGSGNDTLIGGAGVDVLEGGSGRDVLSDLKGSSALVAGSGGSLLDGGAFNDFFAAGANNTTVMTQGGHSVIGFNAGDGALTIQATGAADTLSLGGGISGGALGLEKQGENLVLTVDGHRAITLSDWYAGTRHQSVVTLQILEGASSTYNANSPNPLVNKKVEIFDFTKLVAEFNNARAAHHALRGWSVAQGLGGAQQGGSDIAALGGDLAYEYGTLGHLTGMNLTAADNVLTSARFGVSAQTLHPWGTISGSGPALK